MVAEIDHLRERNRELFPFLLDDMNAGIELAAPPDGHDDNCDYCQWYARSLRWQARVDAGEFGDMRTGTVHGGSARQ